MKLSLILLVFASSASSSPLSSSQPHCTTSIALAAIYTNTSVTMGGNPLTPLDSPMLTTFNTTTVEDWSFDFVSSTASAGLSITLSRGTAAGHLGAQRIILAVVWPNGTRFQRLFYFDESTITSCPGVVVGTWKNATTAHPATWSFEASDDYKHTLLILDSLGIKGTYRLTSTTPPLYPNGLTYPNAQGNPLFAPLLYWVENVPVGVVEVNLTIDGTPFAFYGIGGRERNWNSKPWGQISGKWNMARGLVGPYAFIVWEYLSKVDGTTYFSAVLMEEGEIVLRTQLNVDSGAGDSFAKIEVKTNGSVHLSSQPPGKPVDSKVTGYVLRMNSASGDAWRFDIDFTRPVYWFPASASYNIGGFVGNVSGGVIGGQQYSGLSSGNLQELVQLANYGVG